MKTVNVYIVRHGETIFNTLDKLQGGADSPLTDKGIQLAIDTGNTLSNVHFNSAYASDMKRAIDTAKLILKPNKYLSHLNGELPEFREAFFGLFEGLDNMSSWKSIATPYGASTQAEMLEEVSPLVVRDRMKKADPTGLAENGEEFITRIHHGFNQIFDSSADNDNVLIVSHGTLIRALAIQYGDSSMDPVHEFPLNGGITKIIVGPNKLTVTEYNQTSI